MVEFMWFPLIPTNIEINPRESNNLKGDFSKRKVISDSASDSPTIGWFDLPAIGRSDCSLKSDSPRPFPCRWHRMRKRRVLLVENGQELEAEGRSLGQEVESVNWRGRELKPRR